MPLSIIILLIVLIGIALRNLSPLPLPIWVIMSFGAVAVLLTQQISFLNALHAINFEVIIYLIGVFIIGQAMEESGYLNGGNGDDGLFGDSQNDTLIGGSGDDYLVGKGGGDEMEGGRGADTFVVGHQGSLGES